MINYFPKYFTNKAIALYFASLIVVTFVFFRHSMSVIWIVTGIVETLSFFYFINYLTKKWTNTPSKLFQKKLFFTALIIRVIWVIFSYFLYQEMTGKPFEFDAADSFTYHKMGMDGAAQFLLGNFNVAKIFGWLGVSDLGYSTYVSIIYMLTGNSIIILRLIKALIGAWTAVLVYKLTVRNFGENTARIAAIIYLLWPNFTYYCGLHLKETEMVFLTVLFIERADYLLRSVKMSFKTIVIPLIIAGILFTFRTVLGAAALFALFTSLLLTSSKTLKKGGKRILIFVWLFIAIGFFMGGRIATEVEQAWSQRNTNQSTSMEFRSKRAGGNVFAEKAGSAIFAPAIFIIPIPTFINIETQQNQQLIHGGNFVKDVLAFFLFFAFIFLIKNKKWREASLIESFMLAYLAVIAFSSFAISERFHLPAMPFYMILVAYGISNITNKQKRFFNWYIIGLFVVILLWNWQKLGGRGLM